MRRVKPITTIQWGRWVATGFLVVSLAGCSTSAPEDGSSCVDASDDEILAWVKEKDPDLPEGVTDEDVARVASDTCGAARASNSPQTFSDDFLDFAVYSASQE